MIICFFLGDMNKTVCTICYLLDRRFIKIDEFQKKEFAYKLCKDGRNKVDDIFERSLKYGHPILDIASYALEELYSPSDNHLQIVNNALKESNLKGLLIKEEDLNISCFYEIGKY